MDVRTLFNEIEKEFDMQHACQGCLKWCSCWSKFKLKMIGRDNQLETQDIIKLKELKKRINKGE